jgi:predicted enzyme related to lactoylglutathione lyase
VYYHVADIVRAREFYEQLLRLKVAIEYEGAPGKWWIEYDIAGATFAIENFDPRGDRAAAGLALEVADIDAALAAVQAANIPLAQDLTEFPRCRSFAIKDPDENEIIFHQRKRADEIPTFDSALAEKVAPYLHERTGRTVAYHQHAADGQTHLFSSNGFFVATERTVAST